MVSDFCRINDIFEVVLCVRIYRQVVWLRSYHRPCPITRDDTVRVTIKKTRGNSPLKRLYLHIEALAFSKPNIVTRMIDSARITQAELGVRELAGEDKGAVDPQNETAHWDAGPEPKVGPGPCWRFTWERKPDMAGVRYQSLEVSERSSVDNLMKDGPSGACF
jgi:hypothetical protein